VARTGRGDAAEDGDLDEVRQWLLFFSEADLHVGDESDHCGLRWAPFRRPWVKERGRVRLALQRGVRVCSKGVQRGFKSSAFSSSSRQIESRVLLLFLWSNARGGSWCSGRER
jgi:hypothetical protein